LEGINELRTSFKSFKERMNRLWQAFDLDKKKQRLSEIETLLGDPNLWNDQDRAQSLTKEASKLKRLIGDIQDLTKKIDDDIGLIDLVEMENDDNMLSDLKKEEESVLRLVKNAEFKRMLSGDSDHLGAVLTINAGAGGTDAQDWAQMLLRMYLRWIELKGYKHEIVDYQDGEEAGIKSATVLVDGDYAYGYLKAESGIHRIVRISPFDSNARRHTSFAAVSASPQVEDDIDLEINEADLKVDTFKSGGAGGQHVNKTESAIRITHMPTGVVVQCQSDRSQHKNRATAMKVLKSKLYERELAIRQEKIDKVNATKKKIEWGSQIRSYVIHPYQMVKDHRTNFEMGNVNAVLDGEIDDFIVEYLMQSGGVKSEK
jgi:peptide chain release factor 2